MTMTNNIQVSPMNGRPLIFTNVKQHSKSELIISLVANTIGWGIWLYFWKVLFTSIAWALGLRLTYRDWFVYGSWEKFETFVVQTAPYGLFLCCVLLVWALQDIWRFRKDIRRGGIRYPSLEQDCLWTKVAAPDLEKARSEKIVMCSHDAGGKLISALPKD